MYSWTLMGSNPMISASTSMNCLSSATSFVSLDVRRTQECGRLSLINVLSTSVLVPFLYSSYPSSRRRTFWFFFPSRICLISSGEAFCLLRAACCSMMMSSKVWCFLANFKAAWNTKLNCCSCLESPFAQAREMCLRDVDLPTPPAPGMQNREDNWKCIETLCLANRTERVERKMTSRNQKCLEHDKWDLPSFHLSQEFWCSLKDISPESFLLAVQWCLPVILCWLYQFFSLCGSIELECKCLPKG